MKILALLIFVSTLIYADVIVVPGGGGGGGSGDIESVAAGTGISGGGTTGAVTITALGDSQDILNCALTATVASSALTIAIKDAAGSDPSATSPCTISFRNATAATGTFSQVSFTAAASIVISNGSSLGCTAATQCVLSVYAIDNAGTPVLGVGNIYALDEGSVQTATVLAGSGGDDAIQTLYATAGQSNKAVKYLGRVTITPAAAFAWTNAVTEISLLPAMKSGWYIDANLGGGTPSLGTAEVAAQTEIVNATLTLTPKNGSAPAGVMCQTTNPADAPVTGASTCDAGSESAGISFAVPVPGVYEVCAAFSQQITMDQGELLNTEFELVETPTNAQTITLHGGNGVLSGFNAADAVGNNESHMYVVNLCSSFNWSNKAAGTIVGVRVFYTQNVAATTPNGSIVLLGGSPAYRVMNFRARRL